MRNADLRPVGRQSGQTIHLRDALMFHGLSCLGLWRWRYFYRISFLEIIPDWGNILAKAASSWSCANACARGPADSLRVGHAVVDPLVIFASANRQVG